MGDRIEVVRHDPGVSYLDVGRKLTGECDRDAIDLEHLPGVERRDLPDGMNAGVGPTGTDDWNPFMKDAKHRVLQRSLDGPEFGTIRTNLALPAV